MPSVEPQTTKPLGDAFWEEGGDWQERPLPDLSFGERMARAKDCMAGWPECEYAGKSHQHDLAETLHGHVLTLFVSDPGSAMGASGMYFVTERMSERWGGLHLGLPDHRWTDDGTGHCTACGPTGPDRCDRSYHR